MLRDPADAPSLWGTTNTPDTPDTPVPAQVSADTEVSGGTSDPHTPAPAPPQAPAPPKEPAPGPAEVAVVDDDTPVKVGPGWGERLGAWARDSFVPPEIWSQDRPSLQKQLAYARTGEWGPDQGWIRTAGLIAFWAVSLPTSVAAYALEWVGERPSRWVTAVVLIWLLWHIPYVPQVLGVLVRVPAWPLTATWSVLTTWF